jgi:hypothetical protein
MSFYNCPQSSFVFSPAFLCVNNHHLLKEHWLLCTWSDECGSVDSKLLDFSLTLAHSLMSINYWRQCKQYINYLCFHLHDCKKTLNLEPHNYGFPASSIWIVILLLFHSHGCKVICKYYYCLRCLHRLIWLQLPHHKLFLIFQSF